MDALHCLLEVENLKLVPLWAQSANATLLMQVVFSSEPSRNLLCATIVCSIVLSLASFQVVVALPSEHKKLS